MHQPRQYDRSLDEGFFADAYARAQTTFYEGHPDVPRQVMRDMLEHVPLYGARVLDLGCGFGDDVEWFTSQRANTTGVDTSIRLIVLARRMHPGLKFRVQDFRELGFPSGLFDVVASRYSLDYVDDIDRVFEEQHRVLKPGGVAVYLVNHPALLKRHLQGGGLAHLPAFDGALTLKKPYRALIDWVRACKNFIMEDALEGREHPAKFSQHDHPLENSFFAMRLRKPKFS